MPNTQQAIMTYLRDSPSADGQPPQIAADTNLLDAGILDSFGVVRLIQFLEEQFGISIPDSDVHLETFASAATIAAYVERRIG